jgi:hypothetical protein
MLGTIGGQGYGVFAANVDNVVIANNVIERCSRHSVYIAKGSATAGVASGVVIDNNVIRDHRSVGFSLTPRPAIFVARGYGIAITNNTIVDYWDGGIYAAQDATTGHATGDVVIRGNRLSGRKNSIASIGVGERVTPTSWLTTNVSVTENDIYLDVLTGGDSQMITVYNGIDVTVSGNRLHVKNLPDAAFRPIAVGEFSARGSKDMDQVTIVGNKMIGTLGAGADTRSGLVRFVRVEPDACSAKNLTISTGYNWTAGASGTGEFYLRTSGSLNPSLPHPFEVYDAGVKLAKSGNLGGLGASSWGYGDNDTLGYPTIYVRLSAGADPDTVAMTADFSSQVRVAGNEVNDNILSTVAEFTATRTNRKITVADFSGFGVGLYVAGDTKPTVFGVSTMEVTNAGAVSIANFNDGVVGQRVTLMFADANTTLTHGANTIRLAGGANFVSTANDTLTIQYDAAGLRWIEVCRSVNG